jgi:hypothetical protein
VGTTATRCRQTFEQHAIESASDLRVPKRVGDGIEPAFSAWEAHRGNLRDLRISGKVQLNHFHTEPLVFAVASCLSLRVARNGSEAACCTLLHGWNRGSRPCKLITDAPNVAGHGVSSLRQDVVQPTQCLDASLTQSKVP